MDETSPEEQNPLIRRVSARPKRLFVIGDIHGCFDELSTLLDFLEQKEKLDQEDLVIFIGDYIDRGGFSKEVVEKLLSFSRMFPKTVFLKGNHEDMLLGFLGLEGDGGEYYLQNGGKDTLLSYGFVTDMPAEEIAAQFPEEHRAFYQRLDHGVLLGEFLFVHAGVDPGKPLSRQSKRDLLWIRQAFTQNTHELPYTVVFGHTPFEEIFFDPPFKLGIDTGLVYGNKLTCLELVEGLVYQVETRDREVQVAILPRQVDSTQ